MVRSGLQQDVINLYRQGVRNAMSKPAEARQAFMLHWRYSFRHPPLKKRDYAAIEHQLRRLSKTLEMLESPSVSRISVSEEMRQWWASLVDSSQTVTSASSAASRVSASATRQISTSARSTTSFAPPPTSGSSLHASFPTPTTSSIQHQLRSFSSTSAWRHSGTETNDKPDTTDIGSTALEKGESAAAGKTRASGEERSGPQTGGQENDKGKERGDQQWGGKLPGHGGT